ncbi:hypothetical protein [Cedratvirus kamchatka]|uniref:Uncharacterized protein n=1 Tax=Cedratvirus kamchatka TaxID=2716914 RepID=A0A6G8MXL3_9VIRU|nr:hypothetical protein [Cedratvirus kamchatka]WIL04039.1 hypothetical protein Clen_109 [Cedratvirus lena]WIL04650.1 hypothetical protein Cduv_170 [Cedratvirus duvanny]
MEEVSFTEIARTYQRSNPDATIIARIPTPFNIEKAKIISLEEVISPSFINRGNKAEVLFYDSENLVRVRKLNPETNAPLDNTFVDYYIFRQDAYDRLRTSVTLENPTGGGSRDLLCPCGKRTRLT